MLKLFVSAVNKDLNLIFYSKENNTTSSSQVFLFNNDKHSINFFNQIEGALKNLGKTFNDLDEIFLVASPGSFMSMRLIRTFVLSILLLNSEVKIYLTSAFLLSFFAYEIIFENRHWTKLTIAIRKTKTNYFSITLDKKQDKKKAMKIESKSIFTLENEFSPNDNIFLVRDFYVNLSDRLILTCKEENVMDFFHQKGDEGESVLKIISGDFSQNDLETCLKRKSLFAEITDFNNYPILDKIQELKET